MRARLALVARCAPFLLAVGLAGCASTQPSADQADGAVAADASDVDASLGPDASPGAADAAAVDGMSATDAGAMPDGGSLPPTGVVLSELRTRGAGGAADEFVELYNPTAAPVVLDATWKLEARSTTSASYASRWVSAGVTIPAHGHFLIAGTGYAGTPAADAALSTGITDASSLRLVHGVDVADAICLQYDATTLAAYDATFTCEGTPMSNLPHNNGTSGASNSDASAERLPGGAAGNGVDTGDNAADFVSRAPATPQSTTSPPTP